MFRTLKVWKKIYQISTRYIKETPINFAYKLIFFILLVASFTFYFLELLDKNNQCYHSIIRLNTVYLIWIRYLPLYIIIKKRYIGYNKDSNTNA